MHIHAALTSVVYVPFAPAFPDLALMLDAPVFFFRNAQHGSGPCAAPGCIWGPMSKGRRSGSCLAGVCSEPTTFNSAQEVAAVVAGMPPGRRVVVGYYATGHSQSGQPTPRYVSRLLQTISCLPDVDGIMTYTMKAAESPCLISPLYEDDGDGDDRQLQHQLGCIVSSAYASIAGLH